MAEKSTSKKAKAEETQSPTLALTDLRPAKGSVRKALRVGRGRASGAGKTSNRGHNGEGQRSGNSRKVGFEGGQMPAYRRMPKLRGVHVANPRKWLELNVKDIEGILASDQNELNYDVLMDRGLLKQDMDGLRLLGNGELNRPVNVEAHYVTPSARQKIEAAGGKVTLCQPLEKKSLS